jgi:hypothetical protein
MAAVSAGSTLKASAMQLEAISRDSDSSAETEPSLTEVLRKSMIASARRFLEVSVALREVRREVYCRMGVVEVGWEG